MRCSTRGHSAHRTQPSPPLAAPGPSNSIPCPFLEPSARSWSHLVGICRQKLSKSSKIDFGLKFEGPGAARGGEGCVRCAECPRVLHRIVRPRPALPIKNPCYQGLVDRSRAGGTQQVPSRPATNPHSATHGEGKSLLHVWRRTVNLRRPARARNKGSAGPKRLDDTRCKTYA